MAITQNRMLELIRIADAFKTKILDYEQAVQGLLKDLPPNATPEQLWGFVQSIQLLANSITLSAQDLEILSMEKAHFKLNATRNLREAKRQRARRGQNLEAINPRSTAPDSINVKFSPKYAHITRELAPKPRENFAAFGQAINPSLIAGLDEGLVRQKLEINKLYEDKKMRAPYADPFDDSIPLEPDHLRALGQAPDDDGELF